MSEELTALNLEEACLKVRKGDMGSIDRLCLPYIRKKKGLLTFLRGDPDRSSLQPVELIASSEALLTVGLYREAMQPLDELVKRAGGAYRIKDLALARAGEIALSRGLPLDLGPIMSELGLSNRDLESALLKMRSKRVKKDPLIEMEKDLLQSMLLHQRTSWIESDILSSGHMRAAHQGFMKAKELAGSLPSEITDHHQARCLLFSGRFLLDIGDHGQGMEEIRKALSISKDIGSVILILECLLSIGAWTEDGAEASQALREAQDIALKIRNSRSLAEAGSILGKRMCREGEKEGVDRILHSAGILKEVTSTLDAAVELSEASLWSVRLGDPKRGIDLARTAYKDLRATHDQEVLTRTLSILFYAYLAADERKKAKKLLIDIITNYSVKRFPESFSILKEAVRDFEWLRADPDTKELFEEETVYLIEREALEEVKTRAREAYPNEFGAMLRGIERITHIEPIMEGSANRSTFMFSMFSRFSQREVPGEGVVHSHPSGSARPSKADVSLFGRFPGINIIIAYPFEDDSMAAYDRMGNRIKLKIAERGS